MNDMSSINAAYVFKPAAVPTLPVVDSQALFPVHRIYCVGRNFADHAIEMGHDPNKEPPFFFQKNPDTLVLRFARRLDFQVRGHPAAMTPSPDAEQQTDQGATGDRPGQA